VKVGDLVRIFDPDENKIDGSTYAALGVLTSIQYKSMRASAYKIVKIYVGGQYLIFDEPYWAVKVVNSS